MTLLHGFILEELAQVREVMETDNSEPWSWNVFIE